jgi:branched-subunit amino acid transport protein
MTASIDSVYILLTTLGLAVVTLVTRSFFLLPEREVPIPGWLRRGLKVAPLAALTAVIVPEVVMTQGRLIDSWQDARLPAALAAGVWYAWRPGVLGPLLAGLVVFLPLRLLWGW